MLTHPNISKKVSCAEKFCVTHTRNLLRHSFGASFFLGLLTLTVLWWPMHAGAQQPTKRVLILTEADPNQPGFSIIARSLQSTIRERSQSRVEFLYEVQQRFAQNADSQTADDELISYLKRKYAGQKIDLVLMMVARRFRTLLERDPTLFGDIPRIFYDFDSEREITNRNLGPNITGVWASLDRHRATLDLALSLKPETRNVVVISGVSPQNSIVLQQAQADFRAYEGRIAFTYLTGEPIEEIKRQLATLDETSIVIFTSFAGDKAGNYYNGPEALSMIAPASAAPIFGSSDTLIGFGIAGGQLLDFEATGRRLGHMSTRVLAGEKPEQIQQETAPSVMTVDWREMQRWGLREDRLPPGSVIKFKQPTFWQAYKWNAIGLVALIILEAILIAWLLALRRRRRLAEEESLRLAELANSEHRRLNEIISNVPGIVWESMIDPLTNQRKTTFISDYVRKMLGYTPQEWLSAPPGLGLRIMPDEDRQKANRESEAVIRSGKDGVSQFRWQDKEGNTVWTESYLSPIIDGNQKVIGLRGVTLDITQRKLAAQALRHAEERDRAILNAIPDLMFVQTLDGVFLDYHAKDSNALFAPPQMFLGKNMRDILPPEVAEKIAECFANAVDGGEPQILEYTLPMNGGDRWFEARMVRSNENILTVVRDITERVLGEEALRAERELLEALVGQLPVSVGLIRGSDLRTQIVNPAYQAVAPGKEMVGKTFDELWPESGKDLAAICRQVLETGEPYHVIDELNAIRRSTDGPLESGYFSWSLHRVRLPGSDGWGLLNTGWETTQRKKTEYALSEREQLLHAMFGSLSSHVVVLDPSGTITYANRLWNEFATANEGDVTTVSTGVNYLEVCQRAVNSGDESSRRVLDGIRAVITMKRPSFRFEYPCHAPNQKRWFLMQVDPMPPEHGGVVVVHTNITDRKQAEQALRESEERFGKAFRANPQPMTISTLADGRYVDVNDAFLEISGYTRAEIIGHTSLELGIWESPEIRQDFINQLKEHGVVVNFESRFRTKNGALRVFLYSAERLELGGEECLIGASSDITERQKAEDALRESRARLVLAYQAANMGTFEWNVQTGVNTWSAELEAMYGLEVGTFAGTQSAWLALVHPDDREKALAGINTAFETGEPGEEEWRVTWPDGSVHWIYGRFQVFTNGGGKPERLTGINIDVTNRKLTLSALRESEERFRNMADTAPVMIWMSGPDKLTTYVNKQWLDFTGNTPEQELGSGWEEGIHPDDRDQSIEAYFSAFDRRAP
ncbi:MAG TPA: PAS domain S-box protein, partial [Pyrinomonadaceae bacterium]|nr:PAS domain S-box protein [Pyrinomonadaceae bacterium]